MFPFSMQVFHEYLIPLLTWIGLTDRFVAHSLEPGIVLCVQQVIRIGQGFQNGSALLTDTGIDFHMVPENQCAFGGGKIY